jgi:hypothetical protein
MSMVKRSTASTGGTSATQTGVAHDSAQPAAQATVTNFTAAPSLLGTTVGILRAERLSLPAPGTASAFAVFDFGVREGQPVVLNNANEFLYLNLGGAAPAGTALSVYVEWTEE